MLDRKIAPPFVKTTTFDLIAPKENKLSNGLSLFFVSGGFQDVLKIELIFEAGRWFEEKYGAAYFTAHSLSKGTKQKSSFEIAQLFDQYGAHLEISPGLDFVSIVLYSLTKNLAPVLQLLMEILTEPTFTEKELDQAKTIFIQNLKVNNEKTSFLASKLFRKNMFGETHPYGSELEESDVHTLQPKHLQKHFLDFFNFTRVFVSGKIDSGIERLVNDTYMQWQNRNFAHDIDHAIQTQPQHQYLKRNESIQSSVRMGTRSLLRAHPEYVPVLFVSHILGGYFGSRLMKNIREEKGLTYGISASIHALKHDSYLVIGADVNKENVNLAFEEIRKELKKLRTTNISFSELETTKNHFIGSLQSEITTPFAHADKIKTINLFGLDQAYYKKMITKIEKITPSKIIEISEMFFNENNFYEVAVG